MDESLMLKVSLVCALVGILVLLFVCDNFVSSNDISSLEEMLGKNVRITGQVVSMIDNPTIKIFKVEDSSGLVEVVVFGDEYLDFGVDDYIDVEGEVVEYEEKIEVYASKIMVYG